MRWKTATRIIPACAAVILAGCHTPQPFLTGVAARQLDAIDAPEPVTLAAVRAPESEPAPEREDIRGAGDGSMKLDRVIITPSRIAHNVPELSVEMLASGVCEMKDYGGDPGPMARAVAATEKAHAARLAYEQGTGTRNDADEAELVRQDAVVGAQADAVSVLTGWLPGGLIKPLVPMFYQKRDKLPKPVYGDVAIENTDLFTYIQDGREMIAVTGLVRNHGKSRVELPPVTLRAIDQWDFPIAGISSLLPFEALDPGEEKPFELPFINAPDTTAEVYVHFAPPFWYRMRRRCDETATIEAPRESGDYNASELNLRAQVYRAEAEAAWRCQDEGKRACIAGDRQRLHWRDLFMMAEALDEAREATVASDEPARQQALGQVRTLAQQALARAGAISKDIAVEVARAAYGRDRDGLFVELAGTLHNTGDTERNVTALMVAFVDRLDLPFSSLAVPETVALAPGASVAFAHRLKAGSAGGVGVEEVDMTDAERKSDDAPARLPPEDIAWEIRVGAVASD